MESGPPDTATTTEDPGSNIAWRRAAAVTRWSTRATAGGRGSRLHGAPDRPAPVALDGTALGGHAGHPHLGPRDLLERGHVARTLPDATEPGLPRHLNRAGDEPLAKVVLTDLDVEADCLLERRLHAAPVAPLVQGL